MRARSFKVRTGSGRRQARFRGVLLRRIDEIVGEEQVDDSMASKATPSETLAWWARAAEARRIARLLSPRDAQIAEAYTAKYGDHARAASFRGPLRDGGRARG